MVRSSKETAIAWAHADCCSIAPGLVSEIMWDEIRADTLPPGVDYFLFDCAQSVGSELACRWLRNVLGLFPGTPPAITGPLTADELPLLDSFDPEVLVSGIEMLWRRRLKSSPAWTDVGRQQTNHVNRVKHRALKLIKNVASAE